MITVRELEELRHRALIDFRHERVKLARLTAWLDLRIAELQPVVLAPGAVPRAWWIGSPGRSRLYMHAPHALDAAHRVFAGKDVAATELVRAGTRHVENAARNALARTADWVENNTPCAPLALALRHIGIRDGVLLYREDAHTPKILTERVKHISVPDPG